MRKDAIKNPHAEVLQEIELGLWEHDVRVDEDIALPYSYDNKTFMACVKIFMSGAMWKMWEFTEGQSVEVKSAKAEEMGNALRELILKFTGIDTREEFKK